MQTRDQPSRGDVSVSAGDRPTIGHVHPLARVQRLRALTAIALLLATLRPEGVARPADAGFAAQIAALSEPEGYFDTDNLISNERSYLHVIGDLEAAALKGGAYAGVGPDQNFSYIAAVRPSIAFIVDIRRDNLLLHLLFRALFEQARTRVEYLALLFGRALPADRDAWRTQPVERLVAYVDGNNPDARTVAALRQHTTAVISGFGVPLSATDVATIDRFHKSFITAGLGLRFETTGRAPQSHYPTYRDLLLSVDSRGRQKNFLAAEEDFQFVRSLQRRNLIIPVIGDLSGPRAVRAIGEVMRGRGDRLSAFYASNVEFYLARAGTADRFVENLAHLPRKTDAVIIRSLFGRFNGGSTSVVEQIDKVVAAPR